MGIQCLKRAQCVLCFVDNQQSHFLTDGVIASTKAALLSTNTSVCHIFFLLKLKAFARLLKINPERLYASRCYNWYSSKHCLHTGYEVTQNADCGCEVCVKSV